MTVSLYLVHGWGFDASFWDPMLQHLPSLKASVVDKGYFGCPYAAPKPEQPYLAIGHSAGTLDLLGQDLPECLGLIMFNGFGRFSESNDFLEGVSLRVLERMKRQLQRSPKTVLNDFRQRCGTDKPIPSDPVTAVLNQGLEHLIQNDERNAVIRWENRLHWMTGMSDPFLPAQAGFSVPGERVEGGHLLPLEQPELCADFVLRQVEQHG
ncbi:MAG: biotin synthase [Gluconobacter cerinus]|uniref:biotin synthase n=1 Tax=Gluconobacter cerinus TaxID=38307 RepID=UPI0039E7B234